jgi:PPP family 3-phenylpropionic acid transporter
LIAYLPITPILVVAQLMHSGTFAAHHSGSLKMLQTWFTGHSQARGQALHTSVSYGLGGTVGGLAAGWVWEHWGAAHVFGVAAISGLIGYYCMYKIKR